MTPAIRLTALACLLAPLAAACSNDSGEPVAQRSAVLTRATSCDDLDQLVKRDQIARVRLTAQELLTQAAYGGGRFSGEESGGTVDNGAQDPNAPAAPSGHSETNNQVAGVDEADPPVAARGQRIEDLAIEHEDAEHPCALAQGVMQRGVVDMAQVAPEPH